jgi:hypothetical protein
MAASFRRFRRGDFTRTLLAFLPACKFVHGHRKVNQRHRVLADKKFQSVFIRGSPKIICPTILPQNNPKINMLIFAAFFGILI